MAIIPADEKVFMVDKRTNTTYGGSAALQAMQEWYTMQDVADSVQPYKVFTALLTQTGNTNPQEKNDGDELLAGITYYIDVNDGYDFTPYGAPDNNVGTYFICNQNVTTTTGTFFNLIFNTAAPVATVLENTIGNVWFEYVAAGVYNLDSDLLFTSKTFIPNGTSIGPTVFNYLIESDGTGVGGRGYFFYKADPGTVRVSTLIDTELFGDNVLNTTPIEIRVYN